MVIFVKKFKSIIIIILMIFSFYLSDKITSLAINKNPIMQKITQTSESLSVMGKDATIIENTIIPGIAGKQVDEEASFFKMKEFGSFNETFLVFEKVKPKISLEDNKDKIIIQGNKSLRQVSIIIEDDEKLIKYFNDANIKVSILSTLETTLDKDEYINSENTKNKFQDLDSVLKKNDMNKKICIIKYSNIQECKNKKYLLVSPSINVSNSNIVKDKQSINNGSIILIDKLVSYESIKIILNQIKYLDLNVVYLSELITE